MRIGDKVEFTPSAWEAKVAMRADMQAPQVLCGTVVWLHPAGRFYTVAAEVNGNVIRESFLGTSAPETCVAIHGTCNEKARWVG